MNNDFLPIILGSDENAYGMSRAFFERYGVRPLLLCKQRLAATQYSRILDIVQIDGFDSDDKFAPKLTEILKAHAGKKLLLIPCSDRYTELVVKFSAKIEPYIENRFITESLLDEFVTKDKFYALCDRHGLRYPKTVICTPEQRLTVLDSLPFGFPLIVKANNSNSYAFLMSEFAGKKKVYFVETPEEFATIMQNMNRSDYNDNLIIQEFIPGDDTCMRVLNSYSDKGGKVKLMCLGRPVLEEYTPHALGNYAAIMADCDHGLYAKMKKFLEDIGYVGFSNFDLKFDRRTNEYVLFEINPRQGRSSFFVTASGYNLAEFLVKDVVYHEDGTVYRDGTAYENGTVYGNGEFLWLSVPKSILFTYIDNTEVLEKIRRLIHEKKYGYTLLYQKDLSLMRYMKMKRFIGRHHKNYKRYFFKKTT